MFIRQTVKAISRSHFFGLCRSLCEEEYYCHREMQRVFAPLHSNVPSRIRKPLPAPCTALWKVDFGFNEFRLCHFFRILECFNMRYISDISYARIMKYGNPDTHFLRFFKFFLDIQHIWVKLNNKITFLIFFPISCLK